MKLVASVVKEAISFFQPCELVSNDAQKRRPNETVINWSLQYPTYKEIYIVHRSIDVLELCYHLNEKNNQYSHIVKVGVTYSWFV
jgi:hypothetical protein